MGRIELAPATLAEWPAACRLALGNSPADLLDTRTARLLELVRAGTFDPVGLILARQNGTPVGAIAAQVLPGGSGVVLPPFGLDSAIREALVGSATELFRRTGTILIHCLLGEAEAAQSAPLLGGGFRHVTQIQHMLRHGTSLPDFAQRTSSKLKFVPYSDALEAEFADTLQRTYVGTLDLPETTVDRPAAQQLEGYRHGQPNPPDWWLAVDGPGRPVGVVMLSKLQLAGVWEIAYLGLIPEARGQGLGHELIRHAILESGRLGHVDFGLSVDVRNVPATKLYHDWMFRMYELQDLYLLRLPPAP
jgi:mycothiol synthase